MALACAAIIVSAVGPAGTSSLWASQTTCDPPHPHATGSFSNETITTSDSVQREYNLHVPSSYTGNQAMPLVFSFHGFTSNNFQQDLYSELPAKSQETGFILVTPQGLPNADGYPHWNSSQQPSPEPDDVAFVDELLSALQSQLCIDPARVFATGISNGGFMSSRLGCSLSNRIAAIAPVAGTSFFGSCSSRAVPVIAFHGTNDLLVPFGPIEATAIPAWATHNGCAGPAAENPLTGTTGVRLVRYDGCVDGATVELYVIFDADLGTPGDQGGGHAWPGSTLVVPPPYDAIVGLTTHEIRANDLMWDFFLAHPLPNAPKPVNGPQPPSLGGAASYPDVSSGSNTAVLAGIVTIAVALGLLGAVWYARWRHRAGW